MEYQNLLNRLCNTNKFGAVKCGLANIQKLCNHFGNPEKKFKSIHIAGSNGKGSVTTKIAKALQSEGYRVGLFTSPHIENFRERIRINGEMISEETFTDLIKKIFAFADSINLQPTFFEMTTLIAFLYFAQEKVDFASIETGLGGRLDSTNVITPIASIITSISLDHCEILGATKEKIALEKAGIIKPGCPVFVGPHALPHLLAPIAASLNSPFIAVEGEFDDYEDENNAIASCCLKYLRVSQHAISEGLTVNPPCRLEIVSFEHLDKEKCPVAVIMDVAHNPDGFERLFRTLEKRFPKKNIRIVCGLSKNKDSVASARTLARYGSAFHSVSGCTERTLPAVLVDHTLNSVGVSISRRWLKPTLEENLAFAFDSAAADRELLVICGSFYIMSSVKSYFTKVQ